MWTLRAAGALDEAMMFRLVPGAVKTIGRATGADFVLDVALVSRLHCQLEASDSGIEVVDLSSTNGIYVNDRRVTRARLTNGDRLRVGRVELMVARQV